MPTEQFKYMFVLNVHADYIIVCIPLVLIITREPKYETRRANTSVIVANVTIIIYGEKFLISFS